MKLLHSPLSHVLIFVLAVMVTSAIAKAQVCRPSGKLRGTQSKCNTDYGADCCKSGELYTTYKCSPPMMGCTKAALTMNSFEKGGDGGLPSECDNHFHSDNMHVVALSTGWYNNGKRCHKEITINGNGRSVKAKVVDKCDSMLGCDKDHDFQPPCPNNIVDASKRCGRLYAFPRAIGGRWRSSGLRTDGIS